MKGQEFTREREGILERVAWKLDSHAGLVAMYAVALVLRLAIVPYAGFYGDIALFKEWAIRLATVGPRHFYIHGQLQDYPPGYLYVLWFTGKIAASPGYLLLKLPAVVADLGLAWIAGTFAERLAPADMTRRWPVRTLVAGAVLFNPAVFGVSAIWGQVDSVPDTLVLGSLLILLTGKRSLKRDVAAFVLLAVALAMKPQVAFVLPAMVYALYRRYLHGRPSDELFAGALRVAAVTAPALVLWAVSGLPFGVGPIELFRFDRHSTATYPVTSANAFNLWGAVAFWRNDSAGAHVLRVAGVPALYVGTILFLAVLVFVLWRVHRAIGRGADEARAVTAAAALVSLLGFLTLTRIHERYLFLALVCLTPLLVHRLLRPWYTALCLLFVVNLWLPYGSQWSWSTPLHPESLFDWVFGMGTDAWQRRAWSLAIVAVGLVVAFLSLRFAERPAREREA